MNLKLFELGTWNGVNGSELAFTAFNGEMVTAVRNFELITRSFQIAMPG
jgi:hypothetical protein